MKYINLNQISKVISDKMKQNRKRILIDHQLEKCANIECNLGIDSTRRERLQAAWKQRELLKAVKTIDNEFWILILKNFIFIRHMFI